MSANDSLPLHLLNDNYLKKWFSNQYKKKPMPWTHEMGKKTNKLNALKIKWMVGINKKQEIGNKIAKCAQNRKWMMSDQ